MMKLGYYIDTHGFHAPVKYHDTLGYLQEKVGGYIEYLPINDELAIIVNEEGKIMDLEINVIASRIIRYLGIKDIIVGNCMIVATNGEQNETLSINQLQYIKHLIRESA